MLNNDQLLLAQLTSHGEGDALVKRRAIAKTITLFESTLPEHRIRADALLQEFLPLTGQSFRISISGVPGVGKSTFIESLGLFLIDQGFKVAVLAIDPSSTISGGSILGDKTRMEQLCLSEKAFIRPSPSSGNLGGVAEKTREAMLVLEAAGCDLIIVETVGVGQSEITASQMTDIFVLLQLPNAGDDLQAIKKGVMEIADLVVVNKADIDQLAASKAQQHLQGALHLMAPRVSHETSELDLWQPQAMCMSALDPQQIKGFWHQLQQFHLIHHSGL